MKCFALSAYIKQRINAGTLAVTLPLTLACLTADGMAQEMQKASWSVPVANAEYTQHLNVEVGDVPGHMLRIYEVRRKFSDEPPVFAGTRAIEAWDRGQADYVDLNGPTWGYTTFLMANGDKVWARFSGALRTTLGSDGKKETVYSGTTLLTGGTGQFKGIRGLFHETDTVDIAAGSSQTAVTGEYWFEE